MNNANRIKFCGKAALRKTLLTSMTIVDIILSIQNNISGSRVYHKQLHQYLSVKCCYSKTDNANEILIPMDVC